MEPQWGGEKSLKAAEKDHTLTDRVCAFKTSWAECRDQKRCRHRANGGDFSLDIHSYRTILFIPLSVPPYKRETDWAASCAEVLLRRCPACERDSIIGHGRRCKQAHDEHHDWIGIRRGRCPGCGKTFTFLLLLSLPYTHYSLLTRCQALRRRSVEHCSWEQAMPTLKDPNRVPDSSTLRRWAHGLDCSQPALSFLRQTLTCITHWLAPGDSVDQQAGPLAWLTRVVQVLWPLRC